MLTSNVQLDYILQSGGGANCPKQFMLPPPRISNRMDNQHFLLYHLLQECLVERDINIISVNLKFLHQMFTWVTYRHVVWGKLLRAVYFAPRKYFIEKG